MSLFQYRQVATLLIITYLLVTVVERVSAICAPACAKQYTQVCAQGAGTAVRLAGTTCGWKANTSRVDGSTRTFTQWTSLSPASW